MKEEQNEKSSKLMILTMVLAIGLIVVSGLFALNMKKADVTISGTTAQQQTVTVSETVEKETMPDEVEVYVEIQTDAETAQDAKDQNAKVSDAVLNALQDSGIDADQIETSSYYLNEKTKWDEDKEEYLNVGYTLTHIIKITTQDIDSSGEIIDVAVNAGATGVNNVAFTLTHDKEMELKEQALTEAAAKAKEKAAVLVKAVDTDLGELISMTESSYYNWPRPYYANSLLMSKSSESISYDTAISPQELTVSATVTLTYAIEQ